MPAAPSAKRKVTCAGPGCRNRFVPSRSTAQFCSPSCSQRARRGTKRPAAKPVATKPITAEQAPAPKRQTAPARSTAAADSHKLVVALRQELEAAGAEDTFEGQLALELARRLVTPNEGASALADKVRAARERALAQAKPAGDGDEGPAPEPEDDEVAKARKAREAKAAAAAASGA